MTSLRCAEVEFPEILFETDMLIDLVIRPLHLRSSGVAGRGFSCSLVAASLNNGLLSVGDLSQRLSGHVVRIDHTGVNIPASALARSRWENLLFRVGQISALYESWENKDWLFVLPAIPEENRSGIQSFVPGREPKFELVYDVYTSCPLFQFSLVTDFSREETERLFPWPSGKALPGLENVFLSVETASPWPGLRIRFDLYYGGGDLDWETGRMLVTQGRRRA